MDIVTLLQAETVLVKSAEMAQRDPYGLKITVVSISVVFLSLALLFVLYYLIGRVVNRFDRNNQNPKNATDTKVEASTAEPEDAEPHDKESFVITISPKDKISIRNMAPIAGRSASELTYSSKNITAPLPGVITSVKVKEGELIKSGQVVAVLEAMKMENDLQSERDGRVKEVKVEKGDSVLEGAVIITLE